MTIQFPNNLDTLTNPTGTDEVAVVSHAGQHADANDAIEAIEAKVGVDNSAVTSTHDYKLSSVVAGGKVADGTAFSAHTSNTSNPHTVTASQLGVDTTSASDAKLALKADKTNVLELDNTTAFTPTADYQPTTKKFVEDYVTSTGKESVGLLTQGKFIDSIETNLKFSKKQGLTSVTNTGAISPESMDSLDGSEYVFTVHASSDPQFYSYTKSGTVFTLGNTFEINNSAHTGGTIKMLSATRTVYAGFWGGFVRVYLQGKSGGVWSNGTSTTIPVTNSSSTTVLDIIRIDANNFYLAYINGGSSIRIDKFMIVSGTVLKDTSFTTAIISGGGIITGSRAVFNSTSEIFIRTSSTIVKKYSFSSGTTAQIGNNGTIVSSTSIGRIDNNKIYVDQTGLHTYAFDGTDFVLESVTDVNPTIYPTAVWVQSPTQIQKHNELYTLIGSGYENSIEDMDATGHLGYMISTSNTDTGTTNNSGIIITNSTNNNSTYTVSSFTADKVVLNAATTVSVEETEVARISANLANMERWAWSVKDGNYYLRVES